VFGVLNNWDFKFSGQGLMAGSEAVPLTPPGHRVLYAPNAPAPGDNQATNAAAGGGGVPHITHTASGTRALQMQPLQQQRQQPAASAPTQTQSQAGLRFRGGSASTGSSDSAAAAPSALPAGAAATAPPQRHAQQAGPAGIMATVGAWWDAVKARAADLWQWLLRELAFAAVTLMQWLLWLVVAPVKAVLGPGYRYNRYVLGGRCLAVPGGMSWNA
jgi:hypothetical protein